MQQHNQSTLRNCNKPLAGMNTSRPVSRMSEIVSSSVSLYTGLCTGSYLRDPDITWRDDKSPCLPECCASGSASTMVKYIKPRSKNLRGMADQALPPCPCPVPPSRLSEYAIMEGREGGGGVSYAVSSCFCFCLFPIQ